MALKKVIENILDNAIHEEKTNEADVQVPASLKKDVDNLLWLSDELETLIAYIGRNAKSMDNLKNFIKSNKDQLSRAGVNIGTLNLMLDIFSYLNTRKSTYTKELKKLHNPTLWQDLKAVFSADW